MFCVLSISSILIDSKIEETDDEAMERYYRENLAVILRELKIKEGDATIKPKGFRPMLVNEDLPDLPDTLKVNKLSLIDSSAIQKNYETVALSDGYVSYEIELYRCRNSKDDDKKITDGIVVTYTTNQKIAFKIIFDHIMNTSMAMEDVVKDYHKSDELKLGEVCLFEYLFKDRINTNKKNHILFVNNSTTFVVGSITEDVSSLAKYLDAKYAALTKEINSPPAFRKWFMLDGIFLVEGKYVSSDLVKVVLVDKNGKQLEIELSKLLPIDKLYTKRRHEINKATEKNNKNNNPQKSK
jgi:hypothetical protein